jgi:SnoaL-like domain
MSVSTEDLNGLIDREKIRDCLARLSRGLDRRDARLVSTSYWPEAVDDHGVFVGSAEEFLNWVVPGFPAMRLTLHTLGQSLIDLRGASAVVETHVTTYHRVDVNGQDRDIIVGSRYLDRMEKRDQQWRIAHRKMVYDWLRDFGQSVDWSQGMLGMPFLSQQCVGQARGDYSETLFG